VCVCVCVSIKSNTYVMMQNPWNLSVGVCYNVVIICANNICEVL
jgi:hypothetical protein